MSDESDDRVRALTDRLRSLCQKGMTQKLSEPEQSALIAEMESIRKELELLTGCTVVEIDPKEEAKTAFDAHYRRKADLDRKFFGNRP